MKLNNIIKSSALAALLLTAGACSDDNIFFPDGTWNGTVPDEWTMTLVIPDPQIVNVGGTRAYDGDDLSVDQINVILYKDATILSNTVLDASSWTVNEDCTVTVTAPLAADATDIAIVLNAPSTYTSTSLTDPSTEFVTGEQTNPVLWGKTTINKAVTSSSMTLLRNTAMVTVKMDESKVTNFDISLVGVVGTSASGSLGPDNPVSDDKVTGELPTTVTVPASGTMTYLPAAGEEDDNMKAWVGESDDSNSNVKFTSLTGFYETLATYGDKNLDWNGTKVGNDYPRVIIKGRYKDPSDGTSIEGYYVVALTERSEKNDNGVSETPSHFTYGDFLPMLRNHEYVINITDVRGDGWPTLDKAMQALPDNRLTVKVEDRSIDITDIEATRDYYLGVGADVVATYKGNAILKVITSYPGVPATDNWYDRLDFESDEDWIYTDGSGDNVIRRIEENPGVGKAIEYTLEVKLKENTDPDDRYGKIRVRAGKLSREIFVTQEGHPYARQRPIKVSGMGSTPINDYFAWVEGFEYKDGNKTTVEVPDSVQGMSSGANRNVQRRNGLHFPAVPLYDNVVYEMQAKTGETATITEGTSTFEVETTGSTYKIKLKSDVASTPGIATGRLKITNFDGTGKTVEYPLYRTGVIHKLQASASQYQPDVPSAQRSGWFYYEVVKIGDTYVLDRDLGAASNRFYTKGSTTYRKNTAAVGGYFKVNYHRWADYKKDEATQNRREDQETITAQLGLVAQTPANGKFVMATEADVLSWNIATDGTTVSAGIQAGRVADNKIYFPKIGYYEGDELKSDMHTIFWTRTYLGGTQGLGVDSDEYGYWYRYYDDMKSTNPENRFSNISMARGAGVNKKAPDDNSVWRYMPLRLVWVTEDCKNPSGGSTPADHTVTGKMVIYFEDALDWGGVHYHAWKLTNGSTNWGTRPAMDPVDGKPNLYRVEIAPPSDAGAGILFTAPGKEDNPNSTVNFNSLYQEYTAGNTVLYFKPTANSSGRCTLTVTKGSEDNYGGNTPTPPTPPDPPTPSTDSYCLHGSFASDTWADVDMEVVSGKYVKKDFSFSREACFGVKQKDTNGTQTNWYAYDDLSITTDGVNVWKDGSNGNIRIPAGKYTFTFDPNSSTLRIVSASESGEFNQPMTVIFYWSDNVAYTNEHQWYLARMHYWDVKTTSSDSADYGWDNPATGDYWYNSAHCYYVKIDNVLSLKNAKFMLHCNTNNANDNNTKTGEMDLWTGTTGSSYNSLPNELKTKLGTIDENKYVFLTITSSQIKY